MTTERGVPFWARRSAITLALVLAETSTVHAGDRVLERVADVPLPGPAVRFDYQSLDTTANRLYIAHMNAGELLVFDVKERRVVGTVRDLPRVTGVLAVPSLGKVYASAPGRHEVAVIDAGTLRVIARPGPIGFPDGIAFAPREEKIYVSDEKEGHELVLDGRTNRIVTTVDLGGEAGNTIYDPGTGHILVAVQTRNEWVEIDPALDRVVGRHVLEGAASPHGMALDLPDRLLFIASEENATLQVVDLRTSQVIDHQRVGEEPDVLSFDANSRRLYVSAESGAVSVFDVREGRLVPEGSLTMAHAHSVCADPRSHLVYFPLQDVGGAPVLRIMMPGHP